MDNELDAYMNTPPQGFSAGRSLGVPFSIDLGMSTLQGVISLGPEGVSVEWREYDIMDSPRGELKHAHIPMDSVSSLEYRKTLFGGRLTLLCTSASALKDIPLPAGSLNELRCSIKRRHRQAAGLLAAEASIRLAELG